jgi:5-hydroxyisourate hydrolase-like protein (transthyretin family)/uncharacterized protein (DUF2141 family)
MRRAVSLSRPAPVVGAIVLLHICLTTGAIVAGQESSTTPREPVKGAGTAALRGTVTDDESGRPIPAAQVTLRDTTSRSTKTVSTDVDGRYQFNQVAAGRYTVAFSKGGFVSAQYGQTQRSGPGKTVEVREGLKVNGIDVALTRAGAIEGRVSDENGEPVVEANVVAMRAEAVNGERRLLQTGRTATTNDRGEYRIFGLPPGEYVVSASSSRTSSSFTHDPRQVSQKPSGYAPMFYPATTDISEAEVIHLRPGHNVSDINIVFRPIGLARVAGTLVSSTGPLLDGAHVDLVRATSFGGLVGGSRVAENGAFSIQNVPPGKYVLRARSVPAAAVLEVARTGRVEPLTNAKGLEFASVPVTVNAEDVTDLTVTTAPAGRISGRVKLNGAVYRPSGDKVMVAAVPAEPESIAVAATQELVQKDGTFRVSGIIGPFVLRMRQLQPPTVLSRVEIGGVDATDTGFTVQPRDDISDIDITLTAVGTLLNGRAVSSVQQGPPGTCTVVIFSSDPTHWSLPDTRYVATARPDRDGAFRVAGLPPGRYLAVAMSDVGGGLTEPGYLKSVSKAATSIALENGQSSTVTLSVQVLTRK